MLSESLRVPYRAEDAIGTILVGSVLTLLAGALLGIWGGLLLVSLPVGLVFTPIAVFPNLILGGYLLAVVDTGIHDQSTVPSFVRWGTLVKTGSKSAVVSLVYLLPAVVLCGLAVGGGVATVVSPPGFEGALQAVTGVAIMLSGFGLLIYGLIYLYVRPAARAVFAATGSVRRALGVRRVLRLASTGEYLTGWLIAMGLLVVGPTVLLPVFVVAVALGVVSPVVAFVGVLATLLFGIVLQFVFRVSAAWAIGQGASDGLAAIYAVDTVSVDRETDEVESTEIHTQESNSGYEASPAVQTGRTVSMIPADMRPSESDPRTDGDANTRQPVDTQSTSGRPADRQSKSVADQTADQTTDQSTDQSTGQSTDQTAGQSTDESGFEWRFQDDQ